MPKKRAKRTLLRYRRPKDPVIFANDPAVMRPSRYHIALMRSIINSEPKLIGGYMVCMSHGHCAMGALLVAVGASNKAVAKFENADTISDALGARLWAAFRIDRRDAEVIIQANDRNAHEDDEDDGGVILVSAAVMRERRAAVARALRAIEADPRVRLAWD